MLRGAYVFVAIIFLAIGASFITTTAVLAWEFWDDGWIDILAIDSHLFVFFPTFGLVALVAFYMPSVVFVDHYWRHVRLGKIRFMLGALILIGLSHLIAQSILSSDNRSIWELSPQALQADRGAPVDCATTAGASCRRLPLRTAVANLRQFSQKRIGLEVFVRNCEPDELIDRAVTEGPRRFCVATTPLSSKPDLLDDAACCLAQKRLTTAVRQIWADPNNHSITGRVHAALLPLKVFFLFVLLSISLLLTWRFKAIVQYYREHMTSIEVGLIIGTVATLFFPLMSQAFLQSLTVLAGSSGQGTFSEIVPVMSGAFGLWAFLIIVYFFRSDGDHVELLTKIGSAAAGGIALVQYERVVAYLVWAIGSGAQWFAIFGLVLLAVAVIIVTTRLIWRRRTPDQETAGEAAQ
jgi:hypothetical protein